MQGLLPTEAHWSRSLRCYCGDGQEGLLCLATPLKFQPPRKQADVHRHFYCLCKQPGHQATLSVAEDAAHWYREPGTVLGSPDTAKGQPCRQASSRGRQPWACCVSASQHRPAFPSCRRSVRQRWASHVVVPLNRHRDQTWPLIEVPGAKKTRKCEGSPPNRLLFLESHGPNVLKLQLAFHQGSILQMQASEVPGVGCWYSLNQFYHR